MKQVFITLFFLQYALLCAGQEETPVADSTEKKSTLTVGVLYANNADYFGQKAEERMAYIAAVASYRHRSGFYINGLTYRLLNDSMNTLSASGIGGGYAFNISKRLSADIGYTYTFFPKLSPFLQAANPHMASFALNHTSWFNTSLDVNYAFGKTQDVFTTLGISRQFNIWQPGEKDLVTLTPVIDVTMGTQRFYEYYVEEKLFRDSLLGIPIPPIIPNPPGSGQTVTREKTSFDLLSYNLKLPLAYNRSNYMIEASCQLSLLSNRAQTTPGKVNTFFNASFYYQF